MRRTLKAVFSVVAVIGFIGLPAANAIASDQQPAGAQTVATDDKASLESRMICRNEKTVGSNRAKRVCRTAESIEDEREDTYHALRHRRGTPRATD